MKINSVLDIFGALVLLTLAGLLIKHPQIVGTVGTQFNTALKTARG